MLTKIQEWISANPSHATAIVVCANLGLFVNELAAIVAALLYIAYRLGYLDSAAAWVKAKLGL